MTLPIPMPPRTPTMLPNLKERVLRLIASPSISSTQPQYDQSNQGVIALLENWLSDLRFHCEIQQPVPGKYNLLASIGGEGPGGLLLAGHTDTVPCDPELWRSDPFTLDEREGRWYGLGSCDMKGFFSIAIEAITLALSRPLHHPLRLLATCDEESSMSGVRFLANSGLHLGGAAIIGEPTGLHPIHLHKGIMMERVLFIGQSGHSSDPSLGRNAMEAMYSAIDELMALRSQWQQQYRNPLFTVPYPTLNLGCIHGGDNPNRICGRCSLEFDVRTLPGMEETQVRHSIAQRLQTVAERHRVDLEYQPLFPAVPAFAERPDSVLTRLVEQFTGKPAQAVAFGTEAPYIQTLGCETLVLGPGCIDQAHQPNEYLALTQIQPAIDILSRLIEHYC